MDTASLKQKLEAEKNKLESEMGDIGRRNAGVPDDWEAVPVEIGVESDLADQADVVVNRDTTSAIFTDLEARYDTVLSALRAMEKGIYGTCEVCGKAIEESRLTADPAATTCITHK